MLWIGTSWKMNGTRDFTRRYVEALLAADVDQMDGIQPFVIPSFTSIDVAAGMLKGSRIVVGAQNAHWEDSGAWTGEVSMEQVADAGAKIVELGHSERREHFQETDEAVNLKVRAALSRGLLPLVCVGEPIEVFDAGETIAFVTRQVDSALAGIDDTSTVILAYEPIWAIGESGRAPHRDDLNRTFGVLSDKYANRVSAILYGGSVNFENNQELLGIPGVGGLFIGRSAWSAEGYIKNLELAHSCQCSLP